MRLGRIRFSARKDLINTSQCSQIPSYFYSKTRANNYHPADREFETSDVVPLALPDSRPSHVFCMSLHLMTLLVIRNFFIDVLLNFLFLSFDSDAMI